MFYINMFFFKNSFVSFFLGYISRDTHFSDFTSVLQFPLVSLEPLVDSSKPDPTVFFYSYSSSPSFYSSISFFCIKFSFCFLLVV